MTKITQRQPAFIRCYCTGVVRARVTEAIVVQGCRSVEELHQLTGVCGGCGSCRPELIQLLAELAPQSTAEIGDRGGRSGSDGKIKVEGCAK